MFDFNKKNKKQMVLGAALNVQSKILVYKLVQNHWPAWHSKEHLFSSS